MTSTSLKQPLIVPITNKHYRLVEQYAYHWDLGGTRNRIVIPRGFTYDGASVPRLAWTLSGITPDGLIRAAALVHDWIYRHKGRLPQGSQQYREGNEPWQDAYGAWSRRDADRLFARIMREAGVSKWKRRMAYRAVRWFGGSAWG
jgi:hypothetical protein